MGLLVVVVLLGLTCVRLSEWQFARYTERNQSNTLVRTNLAADPVPVAALLTTAAEPAEADEWRQVTASGHYDAAHQIAVLYRTREGAPGVDVVTPLITDTGSAVLVDRGWIPAASNGNLAQRLPQPATGAVTITGWVRVDSDGNADQVTPSGGSVRALSAQAVAPSLPYPVLDGFLDLTDESPRSPTAPSTVPAPDLGGGPSFFYGFQWLFFALLFFAFWCYFAWAEYREQRSGSASRRTTVSGAAPLASQPASDATPSTSSTTPVT